MRGRITRATAEISQRSRAILRRPTPRKWRNGGEIRGYARYFGSFERFQAKACPALDAGWKPVRVKKTRRLKNPELRFDSIEAGL
jgi:hypothetical protein